MNRKQQENKDKTSCHLIGFPDGMNIGSTVSCRGETHSRYTVHLHFYRRAGTSNKTKTKDTMGVDYSSVCYIGSRMARKYSSHEDVEMVMETCRIITISTHAREPSHHLGYFHFFLENSPFIHKNLTSTSNGLYETKQLSNLA